MRLLLFVVALASAQFLIAPTEAFGQMQHGQTPATRRPATLVRGLTGHTHPIRTSSPEAQRFFDQGMVLLFGFNHEEAIRSFERAAQLDPQAAMPLWGIALALGPNINLDVDPEREKAAYEAVQKALALSAPGNPNAAPEHERDYIVTLAHRYSIAPGADLRRLAENYAQAMRQLSQRYPDDLDAAVLFAESLMDLRPWRLWTLDGRPAEGTMEIVAVLESVLRREPNHIGANHYYIHAVEASPDPQRALPSARRLETLVPAAGHLVHMPAHIYMRTGEYSAAVSSNVTAAEVDRAYLRQNGLEQSLYSFMYYSHNIHFIAAAAGMTGRYAEALRSADQLVRHVGPAVAAMPMLEFFLPTRLFVLLRFNRYDDILREPEPGAKLAMANAFWHFARGVAFAGKSQLSPAAIERAAIETIRSQTPAEAEFGAYFNKSQTFLSLAANILDARMAAARGERARAIEFWRHAVDAEDTLNYGEPPEWYYPTRESLGAALLLDGQASLAEAVFRADLEKNPRNPRSLFGLWRSLAAQNKTADADWVRRQFEAAWLGAGVQLRIEDL
jgi:tetratricopeptide (TPR) repeat protein